MALRRSGCLVSGEGWPTVRQIAGEMRPHLELLHDGDVIDAARAVMELYRPHMESAAQARDAIRGLREIAKVAIPELNLDGVDEAAHTMRRIATSFLFLLGVEVPEQRGSMDDGTSCICGRKEQE